MNRRRLAVLLIAMGLATATFAATNPAVQACHASFGGWSIQGGGGGYGGGYNTATYHDDTITYDVKTDGGGPFTDGVEQKIKWFDYDGVQMGEAIVVVKSFNSPTSTMASYPQGWMGRSTTFNGGQNVRTILAQGGFPRPVASAVYTYRAFVKSSVTVFSTVEAPRSYQMGGSSGNPLY
jgi:hypothetical protein